MFHCPAGFVYEARLNFVPLGPESPLCFIAKKRTEFRLTDLGTLHCFSFSELRFRLSCGGEGFRVDCSSASATLVFFCGWALISRCCHVRNPPPRVTFFQ